MFQLGTAFVLFLAAVSHANAANDEATEWEPESEKATYRILEKGRQSLGELCRFQIECYQSTMDGFGAEEGTRIRLYCEESVGYLYECRGVNPDFLHSPHTTSDGRSYRVRNGRQRTCLVRDRSFTSVNDDNRTYEVGKVERDNWLLSPLFTDLPHHFIPPWFDPTVEMAELKSRFRLKRSQSTTRHLFVEFVPRNEEADFRYGEDERLRKHHAIWIDRPTLRPIKWSMKDGIWDEQTLIYTRFDVDPPKRELTVSLIGYKDVHTIPKPAPSLVESPKPSTVTATLEVGGALLRWLLF